ncbi:MAG TPA: hypothetical protein PLR99_08790 [Polyangiaceae bacterium]|nr:hypothetical protein [Polyangiaceae bacterium]
MRFLVLAALSAIAFSATACSATVEPGAEPTVEESEADIVSSQRTSCGAKYTPALRKYELAVIAAKSVRAKKVCDSVTNPKDGQSTEATDEAVGELLQEAVATCAAFRDVYKTSPYAAPAREVLADSVLGDVVSGALDTKGFTNLEKVLPGKTMFGPKPGIANLFEVSFAAGGKATFRSFDFETGALVSSSATWSVRVGAKVEVTITRGASVTVYTPVLEAGHVVLVPAGEGSRISTSSDPCSA